MVIYRLCFLVCTQDTYVRHLMNAWSGEYSLADPQAHRKIPMNHAASVRTSFAFAEFELSPASTASCKRPWRSCFVFVGRSEIPRRRADVVTLCWRGVGLRPESLVVGALGWAHLGAEPRYGPVYLGRTGGVGEIRGYVLSCNEGRLHDGTVCHDLRVISGGTGVTTGGRDKCETNICQLKVTRPSGHGTSPISTLGLSLHG